MGILNKFLNGNEKLSIESRISNTDKTPNYFLKTLYSTGLAIIVSSGLLAPSIANATDNHLNLQNLASKYEKTGFLNVSNPNINIIYQDKQESGSHHIAGITQSCNVEITLPKSNDNLAKSNFKDNPLYKEMAFYHELSHCVVNKKFENSGLSTSSEKWMTDWVIGDYATFNPVKNLYEENFADTMGMISTLRANNFSDQSINFLKEWINERKEVRIQSEENFSFIYDGHQTDFALESLVKNINKVKTMTEKESEDFAMTMASRSVMYILNSNRKIEGASFVNDNGDLVSGNKISVGNKGYDAIQKVLNNYQDVIFKNAVSYSYIESNYHNQKVSSAPYNIAKKMIDEHNVFNETNSVAVEKNGILSLKIGDNENSIKQFFSGKELVDAFERLKKENNYQDFEIDLKNTLSKEYSIDNPKSISNKQKWENLERILQKSPFSNDREQANILKNKAP